MARWINSVSYAELGSSSSALIALLSTILVFVVCVTALLALCAAHSSTSRDVLNARRETSSEPEELAIAPPEEFKKAHQQDLSSGLSFRLSGGSGGGGGATSTHFKLSSSINKLSSSFRISSFRESTSAAFPGRATSSFRISSFRMDSCKQAEGVVESLRKVRRLNEEEPAVWQRAILRGERCAPLSFSGLILYDENGNQLPSSSTFTEDSEPEPESPPVLQQQQLHQQPSVIETPAFGSRNGNIETGI